MSGFYGKSPGDGAWWLLKVPVRLGTAWSEASDGIVLGEVEVEKSGSMQLNVFHGSQSTHVYDLVRRGIGDACIRRERRR